MKEQSCVERCDGLKPSIYNENANLRKVFAVEELVAVILYSIFSVT